VPSRYISARFNLNYAVKLILHESVFRAAVDCSLVQLKAIYVVTMFVTWVVLLVAGQVQTTDTFEHRN
jgi:hypothetical protein